MRKIYASLLTAAVAFLSSPDASAYKVTVEVDNTDAVEAVLDGNKVQFTDGVAEIEYDGYKYMMFTIKEPYVLKDVQKYTTSSGSWSQDYFSARSYSISLSEQYTDGDKYRLSTGNLDDMRTASVTLKVDDPSAIKFMYSWTNETFQPTQNETTIKYVPGKETPFSISTTSGKNLYKLTVGGNEVTGSYGSYSIYNVNDGDVIDVQANYPDVKHNLVFNLSDECKEGFIKSVTVDNVPLDNWQNAQVQLGSSVSVEYDSSDFKISKFNKNDSPISSYGYYYSPYSFIMDGDVTFDIVAAPYGVASMTVKVADPEHVILYKGYNSSDPANVFTLGGSESKIEVSEMEISIRLRASSLGIITSVSQDGSPLSKDYSDSYNINVKDGSVIEIETEAIVRDDVLVFYFDSPAKANDNSKGFYGYGFRGNDSQREISLEEGYNEVNFGKVDGQLMFTVNNGKTDNVFLYVNGEVPTFSSDDLTYYFTPANGDVLKCFVGEKPASYSLGFDIPETFKQPTVTVDKITVLTNLDSRSVLQGTHVCIVPAEGDTYASVKVAGNVVEPVDGKYEFTVNSDAPVVISDSNQSGMESIDAESTERIIYNMQGMRVTSEELPAGLYIINGKKTIVK